MNVGQTDSSADRVFSIPVRVYWEHTDAGGVVYHSRYLNFFERARSDLLRALGIDQSELQAEHGFGWVVTEMNIKFRKAARLDDELRVTADMTWSKGVRQGFHQEIRHEENGEVLATAEVTAALLHADTFKPARMPAWIKEKLARKEF